MLEVTGSISVYCPWLSMAYLGHLNREEKNGKIKKKEDTELTENL